jgi:hypothetical protein
MLGLAWAYAQAGCAELFGTVFDPAGLAAPGVVVLAEEVATQARFGAVSDSQGIFHLLFPPGNTFSG